MAQRYATFAFGGGLDTNSAALAVPPGNVISSLNYEPLAEGYGRTPGFEQFDGRAAPSDAAYSTIAFDAGTGTAIASGETITGATSGATAHVIQPPYGVTGTWGVDAAGTLVLAAVTGTFQDNEALQVSGVTRAHVDGLITAGGGAPTETLDTTWLIAAQAYYRALIQAVPGSGAVRGVAVHDGTVYAWRDNVGATQMVGFKATAGGWTALTQSRRMAFTAGLAAGISEGDSILGASSGATATVARLVITSGDFAANDAAGWLHLTSVAGTFGAETIKVGGTNRATGAATTLNTFPAGGRVRTLSHNFYGAASRHRLYGATTSGYAFEIKSDVLIPVITGMPVDTPSHIFELANHLGLVFPGGSVQFSSDGEPLTWDALLGAGEIGFGSEVTDVIQANETAVVIFGQTKIATLQGHDASDFVLDTLTEEAGAETDSAQRIGRTVYVDRRGLRSLDATQSYGNFKAGALSGRFERYFREKRRAGAAIVGSYVCRTKSHYRLVWDDGTGLSIYMGGKQPEAMEHEYGEMQPSCFATGEMATDEGMFAGAEDGKVYRLDSGTNYNGTAIRSFVMTPFNHFGEIMQEDRYHSVSLELTGPNEVSIGITVQFDYADGEQPISGQNLFTIAGGSGGVWDESIWNQFFWSQPIEGIADSTIDGVGRNASFIFASDAGLTEQPHVLQAYTVYRSPRRIRRR